jgi:hypothetical protein
MHQPGRGPELRREGPRRERVTPSRFSPLLITWQLVPVGEAVLYDPLPTGSWLAPPPLWGDYVLGLRPG